MFFFLLPSVVHAHSESYQVWLNMKPLSKASIRKINKKAISSIYICHNRFSDVIKDELPASIRSLVRIVPRFADKITDKGIVFIHTEDSTLGNEGYIIQKRQECITVKAYRDAGFLYGMYHLIRMIQNKQLANDRPITLREKPIIGLRMLDHWDDLNGNIERGYAGKSLWKWEELPVTIDSRYEDYARANASIGINAAVLNNVNADPRILRHDYLEKVAKLANVFRKYNIQVFLSLNFSAPLQPSDTPDKMRHWGGVGDLDTADPNNGFVKAWWKNKTEEIYRLIPDFGGFLVKANSEGMPGPQDYLCSHADGANMLADILKPYGGYVIWRTFVYNPQIDKDRLKRPYKEFVPLDGKFHDNVILQAKNGALDFQPSEPPQPLFQKIKKTSMALELQITQEYLGQSTYMVDLVPLWKEFFEFNKHPLKAIAGVANTGNDDNWTGNDFAQYNWYSFGRLAWDPRLDENEIMDDWIAQTWHCSDVAAKKIKQMMNGTWEAFVKSQSPYGLGLVTSSKDHFYAGYQERANKEWIITKDSIGYDRTVSGSNYVSQYDHNYSRLFNDIKTCPEKYLLCFHLVNWGYRMQSGKTLAEELVSGLKSNVDKTKQNISIWMTLREDIDEERYLSVLEHLQKEEIAAIEFYNVADRFFCKYIGNPSFIRTK